MSTPPPLPKPRSKAAPILIGLAIVVGIVAFAVAAAVGSKAVSGFLKSVSTTDGILRITATTVNKTLPRTVDSETRLDSAEALPNQTLAYHYTLVNYKAADVDKDKFQTSLRPQVLQAYKSSPDLKSLRDRNVTLEYQYYDKAGEFVTKFDINPKDF